jgi:hypothetical protein
MKNHVDSIISERKVVYSNNNNNSKKELKVIDNYNYNFIPRKMSNISNIRI